MLRRIGVPCPRCIKGQIVFFHTEDYPACFQCGHEPAAKDLADVLRDFDVKTCSNCRRLLRSTNSTGLCRECVRKGMPCRHCGGPTGIGNISGSCWDCSQRLHQEDGEYRDQARVYGLLGAQARHRSSEPELSAGGKPRGAGALV